jgi:HD-like signal output (HDOD) protein
VKGELALLGKILQLAADPEVPLEEFVGAVGASPNLAARVVRISNSALYGMEGRVQRLDRAVMILGIEAVAGITTSVVVADRARRAQIGGLPSDALWLHSLETGICAELVARLLGIPVHREAYLAGLLHDLGTIDLLEDHGRRYSDLLVRAHRKVLPLWELERDTVGETHADRLGIEAATWGLPEPLRLAVAHQDQPDAAPEHCRTLARIVSASHAVSRGEVAGWSDDPPDGEPLVVLQTLGLTEADAEEIRDAVQERMKSQAPLFS